MVTALPFDTFRVRSLHTMMSMMVLILLKKKHPIVKNNELAMFMRNTFMKKKLNLPCLDPSWSLHQLLCTLALGYSPFPLWSILVVETPCSVPHI